MRRLIPRSLAGQLIALLLIAVVLAQALGFLFFADERRLALRAANRDQLLARTASVVRLIDRLPPALYPEVLASASSAELRFWLADTAAVAPEAMAHFSPRLTARLRQRLPEVPIAEVRVNIERRGPAHPMRAHGEAMMAARHPPHSVTVAVGLADGRWLNAETLIAPPLPGWSPLPIAAILGSAIAIALVTVLMVRRLTRPMRRLAEAAEAFGRGENPPPLAERGPEEAERAARAFNRMQARIRAYVQDRMRMLAAISHDLRTPITALRLRAEMVEDEETREKMLATLAELQQMTEATLAFAREEAREEETRVVDLAALVESLAADAADLGQAVTYEGPDKLAQACRPLALKRALRNLVDNAVTYGGRARLRLRGDKQTITIEVEDEGPGIPPERLETVFEPFFRLEQSRSRQTGGIGLGLAIARSTLRSHGGDIHLENRAEGGLRVTVTLPAA